jgi:hypothetical protein
MKGRRRPTESAKKPLSAKLIAVKMQGRTLQAEVREDYIGTLYRLFHQFSETTFKDFHTFIDDFHFDGQGR